MYSNRRVLLSTLRANLALSHTAWMSPRRSEHLSARSNAEVSRSVCGFLVLTERGADEEEVEVDASVSRASRRGALPDDMVIDDTITVTDAARRTTDDGGRDLGLGGGLGVARGD